MGPHLLYVQICNLYRRACIGLLANFAVGLLFEIFFIVLFVKAVSHGEFKSVLEHSAPVALIKPQNAYIAFMEESKEKSAWLSLASEHLQSFSWWSTLHRLHRILPKRASA